MPGAGARRGIAILGSTGSIGVQALDLIGHCADRFEVVALAAGRNGVLLAEQILRHRPRLVALVDPEQRGEVETAARQVRAEVVIGAEGLLATAAFAPADVVLAAVVGAAGLAPTYHALDSGKTVALANKESLVMAGPLMRAAARRSGGRLVPVDSEHSALHQCLRAARPEEVRRLVLTASGGPVRTLALSQLDTVTPEEAVRHPVWEMGRKISVDSATLMNKGLEVIEAHWLFDIPGDRIDVVLHPQSAVHSMVEMVDGSLICQIGVADMRGPIQYALSYPERFAGPVPPIDLAHPHTMEFFPVDHERFPSLRLAYEALEGGGTLPAALNAANEVAVQAFLDRKLRLTGIPKVVGQVMRRHRPQAADSMDAILDADRRARTEAEDLIARAEGV